ncbi:hypothetical protein RBH26_13385 [Natronolimnohabitans sp. A-GB9]|uniref:hypothetical protein n=1 Tax=Natronolimnohabitans sp. A-GB9 TaxID=3069757 RepID=UPI0027B7E4A7|nr:hypothetical protein [Natronolimnohabitans sp. A-GB9]MDQ2051471.1 hypothetical protein [Natronolimnohabitans sp. A-GB9]
MTASDDSAPPTSALLVTMIAVSLVFAAAAVIVAPGLGPTPVGPDDDTESETDSSDGLSPVGTTVDEPNATDDGADGGGGEPAAVGGDLEDDVGPPDESDRPGDETDDSDDAGPPDDVGPPDDTGPPDDAGPS